ncbi:MAG TPA: DUF3574 domain-containing protein [Thermoanaerobaculia bacterium]|nr:DUF3574 domain-containing protein [Thermoanaerobaculia bacterium]
MRRSALLLIVLALACQTANLQIDDRLYFGRNIPAGGVVSDAQWDDFVRTVITPRFPQGLTIFQTKGQWLDPRGNLVREDTYIVELNHPRSAATEAAIEAIAQEYKRRFGQDAVLRISSPAQLRLY